jgi:hypothetical protein
MIHKPIDRIEKADIESLIANGVAEGRTIEYKQVLPGSKDSEKKEFLADVSSFANAAGGDLFFGIEEQRDSDDKPTGIPADVPGVAMPNTDAEILRLENIIRNGIGPRIAGIRFRSVGGFANGPVLLIRIPRSYAAPHMVVFQESSRFYSRNSRGKYPLDVGEIRAAFALSESLPERVRRFRDERLARIIADETPVTLPPCPKVVLHLFPVTTLDPATHYDLTRFEHRPDDLPPLAGGGIRFRYNLDGIVTYIPPLGNSPCDGYVQLFRNGTIESVESHMLFAQAEEKLIPHAHLESRLISCLRAYLTAQQTLGLEPPIVLLLSLLGVRGYRIGVGPFRDTKPPIDRDAVLLSDVLVEDFSADSAAILHPVFDGVWQAAGWRGCLNYDAQGKWQDRGLTVMV